MTTNRDPSLDPGTRHEQTHFSACVCPPAPATFSVGVPLPAAIRAGGFTQIELKKHYFQHKQSGHQGC